MVMTNIEMEKERINIVLVYDTQGGRNIAERFNKFMGERKVRNIIIGGDFNVRIGELGEGSREEGEVERRSKDRVIGNEGKNYIEWREKRWYILNGKIEEDWEGEYTYVGARGSSVIDYEIVCEEIIEKIRNFRIGEGVDSDHLPLEIEMEIKDKKGREQKEKEHEEPNEKKEREIIRWDKEAILRYTESTEELCRVEEAKGQELGTVEDK